MDYLHNYGWDLYLDDFSFPEYLVVRATGVLDRAFYKTLFSDLRAYMAGTVGLNARLVPIIFDARECLPDRDGLNTLHQLIRDGDCHTDEIVLLISQLGPNATFTHSVALLLRSMMLNVHIVRHMDEALALLGVSTVKQPPPPDLGLNSLTDRFARMSF